MTTGLFDIMPHHEKLEAERKNLQGRLFLSDYHGGHPFLKKYLGELATSSPLQLADISRYAGLDEDMALRTKIAELHCSYDGVRYTPAEVVPSGGSSSLLCTFCIWLMLSGYTRLHYLPPVYYKFAYLFRQFHIEPVPVANRHAFQEGFDLHLPDERTVLILTDPIWYAGRPVPKQVLTTIREWQETTGSLVFVDGTFQYMHWDGTGAEASARLLAEQTLRLVSPTKYLGLHGYRCAYLLAPARYRNELAEMHLNLHGEVTVSDRLFAHRVCEVMANSGNQALLGHIKRNYRRLLERRVVETHLPVDTGFFLFAKVDAPPERFLALDQKFFELEGYPGYVRINLLNETAMEALGRD